MVGVQKKFENAGLGRKILRDQIISSLTHYLMAAQRSNISEAIRTSYQRRSGKSEMMPSTPNIFILAMSAGLLTV